MHIKKMPTWAESMVKNERNRHFGKLISNPNPSGVPLNLVEAKTDDEIFSALEYLRSYDYEDREAILNDWYLGNDNLD